MDKLTLLKAAAWDAAEKAREAWAVHKTARMESWHIGYRVHWQEAPEGTDIDDATERVDSHVANDPLVKDTRRDAMRIQHAANKAAKAAREFVEA